MVHVIDGAPRWLKPVAPLENQLTLPGFDKPGLPAPTLSDTFAPNPTENEPS